MVLGICNCLKSSGSIGNWLNICNCCKCMPFSGMHCCRVTSLMRRSCLVCLISKLCVAPRATRGLKFPYSERWCHCESFYNLGEENLVNGSLSFTQNVAIAAKEVYYRATPELSLNGDIVTLLECHIIRQYRNYFVDMKGAVGKKTQNMVLNLSWMDIFFCSVEIN